jgi:hypothetical protein
MAHIEALREISSTSAQAAYLGIDAGGGASGNWSADRDFSGGNSRVTISAINVSKIADPAPQAVYQTYRWSPTLTYTIPNLTPNGSQTVRLHFAETYFAAAGKRVFNIAINGSRVLSNFDIFRAAGGKNIAIVQQFTAPADASGRLTITLSATINDALINGIEITPAEQAAGTPIIAIDAGGYPSGNWIADANYSGGQTVGYTNPINTSKVTDPAPQSVYQRQRWGPNFSYTIPSFTPGGPYTVRLHFAEGYWTVPSQRVFNVTLNGTRVLRNFDIVQSAGGANIAIVEQFNTTADANGKISIQFAAVFNNATLAGIEVLKGTSAPTPAPTPISTPTPAPIPTAGFGPRVPIGPQATVTCPPKALAVSPGSDVQSVVKANAAGTTYCLAPGTYARQQIVPKSGDTYIGLKGATLDGQETATYAFNSSAPRVTIENFVVVNYSNPSQRAAIAPQSGATNWVIRNNEIAKNGAVGVGAQSESRIVANYIHDNAQEGYTVQGSNVLLTDNEIAHNNPNDAFSHLFEAGGGKAWMTTNLTVAYNYSHDNHGAGLWTDTDNQGSVYKYNKVMNNWGSGISHEISWDAKIDHNLLVNNANPAYCGGVLILTLSCSEIRLSDSGGETGKTVDISYNTIFPNNINAAVGLADSAKGSGLYGTWRIQNVQVHNNIIDLSPGSVIGAVDSDGSAPAMFTTKGNSFDSDAYTGADSSAFYWNGSKLSFAQLQGQGQEIHGTSK